MSSEDEESELPELRARAGVDARGLAETLADNILREDTATKEHDRECMHALLVAAALMEIPIKTLSVGINPHETDYSITIKGYVNLISGRHWHGVFLGKLRDHMLENVSDVYVQITDLIPIVVVRLNMTRFPSALAPTYGRRGVIASVPLRSIDGGGASAAQDLSLLESRSRATVWAQNILKEDTMVKEHDRPYVSAVLVEAALMELPIKSLSVGINATTTDYAISLKGYTSLLSMLQWYDTFLDKNRDRMLANVSDWFVQTSEREGPVVIIRINMIKFRTPSAAATAITPTTITTATRRARQAKPTLTAIAQSVTPSPARRSRRGGANYNY